MRTIIFVLCLLAISLIFAAASYSYEWHTITVDLGIDLCRPSIAMDSNGYPHISYYDESYTYEDLKYAHWTGSQWQIEVVDSQGDVGDASSLALDSQGYPHISYYDWDNGDLKYAYWNGDTWIIQTVDSNASRGALALDSQGYPHIAYCDYINRDVKYAYWNGANWVIETVDSVGDVGLGTSFALDSQDYPHISYIEYVSSYIGNLKYAYWNGSSWEVQIVDYFTEGYGPETCIAVDSQDHPSIIYYCHGLEYARWSGSEWQFQIVDDHHPANSLSLALDNQDFPNISFWSPYMTHPPGEEWGLFYERWDGSQWEVYNPYTLDCYDTSIALDSFDNPHIAHHMYEGDMGLTWYGYGLAISLLSFTATPQEDSSVLLNWRVETTEGEQIAGFNLYRREINYNNDIAAEVLNLGCIWTRVNSSLITGENPYAYTDGNVQGGITYEYKLEAVLTDESTEILGTASCAPTPPAFAITKVYPNPASDVLNIALTLPQSGEVTLELYDLTGRVVATKDIQISSLGEFTDQLDVRELANGVYTLRATQMNLSASERVVVVR